MSHWKNYDPIPRVSAYLSDTASLSDVQVTARVRGRDPTPISVHVEGCDLSFTLEKSAALRAALERAEIDVVSSVPSLHPGPEPVPEVTASPLIGVRCESCCHTIRLGAPVHVYDDAWVHAGSCPGEERGDG